jgi:hypothetical protein
MTNNITTSHVLVLVKDLLSEKCSNYGYDYKDFKRISSQRSKARKNFLDFATWNIATLTERVRHENRIQQSTSDGSLYYVVGQSANEEITNLMRRLVNPKARWVK